MTTAILQGGIDHLKLLNLQQPIAWPDVNFNPPDSGMWVELNLFPNEPLDPVWDNDGCVVTRGFLQILVGYRPGMGRIQASNLADSIIAHFSKGTHLGPVRVLKKPWQSTPVIDSDKIFIPITISYRSLTK